MLRRLPYTPAGNVLLSKSLTGMPDMNVWLFLYDLAATEERISHEASSCQASVSRSSNLDRPPDRHKSANKKIYNPLAPDRFPKWNLHPGHPK